MGIDSRGNKGSFQFTSRLFPTPIKKSTIYVIFVPFPRDSHKISMDTIAIVFSTNR